MCGVIGISNCHNVGTALHDGLEQLQHRGQDSAEIATWGDYRLDIKKGPGLVSEVFVGKEFDGRYGIGHVRYPTFGSTSTTDRMYPLIRNRRIEVDTSGC
jgi:amidophosphoribosyltransferase